MTFAVSTGNHISVAGEGAALLRCSSQGQSLTPPPRVSWYDAKHQKLPLSGGDTKSLQGPLSVRLWALLLSISGQPLQVCLFEGYWNHEIHHDQAV